MRASTIIGIIYPRQSKRLSANQIPPTSVTTHHTPNHCLGMLTLSILSFHQLMYSNPFAHPCEGNHLMKSRRGDMSGPKTNAAHQVQRVIKPHSACQIMGIWKFYWVSDQAGFGIVAILVLFGNISGFTLVLHPYEAYHTVAVFFLFPAQCNDSMDYRAKLTAGYMVQATAKVDDCMIWTSCCNSFHVVSTCYSHDLVVISEPLI